jgi:hypothetical protein
LFWQYQTKKWLHITPPPSPQLKHDSQLLDLALDKYRDNCLTNLYWAFFSKEKTLYGHLAGAEDARRDEHAPMEMKVE